MHQVLDQLRSAIGQIILGKDDVVLHALTAALAGGHILLEDVPGVGKTTLAHTIARALGCSFRRIQFTSDLLPSDILGVNVFSQKHERFEFKPGPIFANVVLADEINRTTPKTQSSLLEAMNEGQVSLDNETRPLPQPFLVIATQNPQDYHGTYPLPESQLDRFMVRLRMGYPADAVERRILQGQTGGAAALEAQTSAAELLEIQAAVARIRVEPVTLDYLMAIVTATRSSPYLSLGISTRGALALQRAARARALLLGRDYVLPDDLKALALPVLAHRVRPASGSEGALWGREAAEEAIKQVLSQVAVPR
jgi:MoxR-like ATPase